LSEWYILNEDKTTSLAVTEEEKIRAYTSIGNRRVDQTEIGNCHVSTVFLGLDHNWDIGGPPLLFETMVFHDGDGEESWRYSTWDEAVEGHEKACRELASGLSREELEASKELIESLISSSDKY
jgi:hypothetical protein